MVHVACYTSQCTWISDHLWFQLDDGDVVCCVVPECEFARYLRLDYVCLYIDAFGSLSMFCAIMSICVCVCLCLLLINWITYTLEL